MFENESTGIDLDRNTADSGSRTDAGTNIRATMGKGNGT